MSDSTIGRGIRRRTKTIKQKHRSGLGLCRKSEPWPTKYTSTWATTTMIPSFGSKANTSHFGSPWLPWRARDSRPSDDEATRIYFPPLSRPWIASLPRKRALPPRRGPKPFQCSSASTDLVGRRKRMHAVVASSVSQARTMKILSTGGKAALPFPSLCCPGLLSPSE